MHYRRWLAIPKIGRRLHGRFYYLGIKKLFKQICEDWSPDVVLATWAYPDAYAVSLLLTSGEIESSLPMVVKVHGTDINAGLEVGWRRHFIREALERADRIVSVSEAMKEKIHLASIGKEVSVIPNGVDETIFHWRGKQECRKQLDLDLDRKHILFVGNLVPVKGLKYLIEAMADLQDDVMLHIVGEGSLTEGTLRGLGKPEKELPSGKGRRPELAGDSESKGKGEQRILFHGRVPHGEIPIWMNAADVFCLPSLQEGCPNVVVEALACGTPVIASKVGGIPELIDCDEKGMLVPPGDSSKLAEALSAVLQKGGSAGALRPASEVRSWADSARELHQVLCKLSGKDSRTEER